MRRRDFVAASGLSLLCRGCASGDESSESGAQDAREPDHVVKGHGGYIAFSPDSTVLAVAGGPINDDYGVCFLDANTGKRRPDFERTTDIRNTVDRNRPKVLAFSPDGKYFAAGGNGYAAIWEVATGRRLQDIDCVAGEPTGTVTSLTFTPDSSRILLGFYWRPIEKPDEHQKFDGLEGYESVAFSTDGKLFATRRQGIITLWEYPSLRKHKDFGVKQPTGGPLVFSADRIHILSRIRVEQAVYYLWNTTTGKPKHIDFEYAPGFDFDLSPDGSLLTSTTRDGIVLLRLADGRAQHLLNESGFRRPKKGAIENGVVKIKFSPNQKTVALSRVSGIHIWIDENGFKG
jgi:hypothetical protein